MRRFDAPSLIVVAAALLVTACQGAPGGPTPTPKPAPTPRPTPVQVAQVQTGDISTTASYAGSILAKNSVNVQAKTSGRILRLYVDVGSRVSAGDPIADLDRSALDAAVSQAEAGVAVAEARLAQMQSPGRQEAVANAQAALAAAQARYNTVAEGVREPDRQAAFSALEAAQAQLASAESTYARLTRPKSSDEVAQAQAALEKTRAALVRAQSEYDQVSWRNDIGATQQAAVLQSATADYQAAQSAYNLLIEPPKGEDVIAAQQAIASARSSVDAAQARINDIQAGPTSNDLAIAQAAVDQAAQTVALQARPFTAQDIAVQRATIQQAQAVVEVARVNLAEATVTAPFDAVVSQKFLSEGALAAPGNPIVSLVSTNVEAIINVEEARIGLFQEGQNATINVAAFPGVDFPAQVSTISPTADPKNRTFSVRLAPTPNDPRLRDGMFAQVQIPTAERKGVLLIPRSALVQRENQNYVFLNQDGKAVQRQIQIGIASTSSVEVTSGLNAGDEVILAEGLQLTDGAPISVVGR